MFLKKMAQLRVSLHSLAPLLPNLLLSACAPSSVSKDYSFCPSKSYPGELCSSAFETAAIYSFVASSYTHLTFFVLPSIPTCRNIRKNCYLIILLSTFRFPHLPFSPIFPVLLLRLSPTSIADISSCFILYSPALHSYRENTSFIQAGEVTT